MTATADLEQNRQTADRLIRRAVRLGATLVVLPEKWQVYGSDTATAAESLGGRTLGWARELAGELQIDLIAGSMVEMAEADERTFNTSPHFTPDGELRAAYRKLHMFDVEVDGEIYSESSLERPGEDIVLTHVGGGVGLGMSICYDLRFPELFRALSARGAMILTVPAAFTLATTRDHWEVLLRARAIENQCFVIAANQIGTHPDGRRTGGRSMIVDPWGLVLACAPDREGVIVADLDLEQLATIRRELPALSHRRPALLS
jgi:predicted amidohydrolase